MTAGIEKEKIKIGITHGDINGISYEVIIKTLIDSRIMDLCTPIIYGSPKIAAYHRKALNINNFSLNNIRDANDANPRRANIINCVDDNVRVELGKLTDMAGKAAYMALDKACQDFQEGKIHALVTAPINKDNMNMANFKFPGHTEYLIQKFNKGGNGMMLMLSSKLRIGLVTGHIPLSAVASTITTDLVYEKLKLLNHALLADFGIRKPKIAVLGLNPHAGENGLIGKEDKEIITPALEKAREDGIMALGPYPSDGLFGSGEAFNFDAILSMYHDQGLTPFKALSFDEGINYTAGLPIIRTSPAHGTGYGIAGKGKASEQPFREALYCAIDIYRKRTEYISLSANQLPKFTTEENAIDE